mgnify:CR=1 FL=1
MRERLRATGIPFDIRRAHPYSVYPELDFDIPTRSEGDSLARYLEVRFGRIARSVGAILTTREWAHPVPVVITCGTIEENLANNRAVRRALERQGYDVRLVENRDGHNWVGWRDTFDPHLTELLREMWT